MYFGRVHCAGNAYDSNFLTWMSICGIVIVGSLVSGFAGIRIRIPLAFNSEQRRYRAKSHSDSEIRSWVLYIIYTAVPRTSI